ncbi:class I SAM-dependent methyltransferase [Kroppenstedtia eburnea]|uniref:class I SAM-dependent methyltransferase n=1 Tax=Kroppenstedtia eburnea TaxID=714067 RepID=UPI00020C82F5|nr:type 12 methyltransferase [Desmospora sp. 8437]
MEDNGSTLWEEEDSRLFLKYGHIFVPERERLARAFIDLIPADQDEAFRLVELGVGGGWLSEVILDHFPRAEVIALDGSPSMIEATRGRLARFSDRLRFQRFDLLDEHWPDSLDEVRCFVSSLAIHHLDGKGKARLFRKLYGCLQPGGALLIADIMKEAGDRGRQYMARAWEEETARRSLDFLGDLEGLEIFRRERWNLFLHPDEEVDHPSTLFEQLGWMHEAGYRGVDAFWVKAGHALFGGYKEVTLSE